MDLPTGTKPPQWSSVTTIIALIATYVVYSSAKAVYDVYFGPLSKLPGPKLRALSCIPYIRTLGGGTDNTDHVALHQQYGPIVRVSPRQISFASGANAWKDIYGFRKHGQPKAFKDPQFYGLPINRVHSIITANDENHSRQRKILTHSFSDKALKEQEPILKHWAEKLMQKLQERATQGVKTDVLAYFNYTTFDVMGDLCFNEGLDMLENSEYVPWVKTIFLGIKSATFFRAIKYYSHLTNYLIEDVLMRSNTVRQKQLEHWNYTKERVDRRLGKSPERPDLWTKIIDKSEGPDGLTVAEHHSIGSLSMIAGTETTATALSGTTYHLLQNRTHLDKLTAEVRETFETFDDINLEALARMKYLHAVLQEGMRMYPPVPTSLPRRVPKGGMVVDGYFLPETTTVGVHQLSTYRMESHWRKANEFHPERWLGDEEFKDDNFDAFEPFSVGPRNCLGKNLAWHEMRMLLVTVLLNFNLQLCEESKDWNDQKVFTLWEKKPLMCTLSPAKA